MSGNLAFLNWLTALPAVMCFDDAFVAFLFAKHEVRRAVQAEENYKYALPWCVWHAQCCCVEFSTGRSTSTHLPPMFAHPVLHQRSLFLSGSLDGRKTVSGMGVSWAGASISVRRVVTLAMGLWIAYLSYPVVNNILSPSQVLRESALCVYCGDFRREPAEVHIYWSCPSRRRLCCTLLVSRFVPYFLLSTDQRICSSLSPMRRAGDEHKLRSLPHCELLRRIRFHHQSQTRGASHVFLRLLFCKFPEFDAALVSVQSNACTNPICCSNI
jgi:hypothetical protein